MGRIEKTVFISYRRTNLPWALAIYQELTHHGFDVFFDYESIKSGDFEQTIIQNIKGRAHFVVLLTPSALERCADPSDWLRREIETALEEKRNIVPLMLEGFNFSNPLLSKHLTGKIAALKRYNGLNVPSDYFEAAMKRLREDRLNIELNAVLHPISFAVQEVVRNQQLAANRAEKAQIPDYFKLATLGPDSSYTFLYGKNGIWWDGIPDSLADKIKEIYQSEHEFKSIALGPNSSYVFLYGKNGAWWSGIPDSLADKINEAYAEDLEFKYIALGPDSSYVFFYGNNNVWWDNIPNSLADNIKEAYTEGHELKSVALGSDFSYIFLFGKNGASWYGIPDNLVTIIREAHAEDHEFKPAAMGPNFSYVFLYGHNGYWCINIPESLKNKIIEIYGQSNY